MPRLRRTHGLTPHAALPWAGTGFLTWLNTDMTEEGRSHCCGPRWGGGRQACANTTDGEGQICGSCCVAQGNYTGNSVPCDPLLPVIPENHAEAGPAYGPRDAHSSDPTEHVSEQMIGNNDSAW